MAFVGIYIFTAGPKVPHLWAHNLSGENIFGRTSLNSDIVCYYVDYKLNRFEHVDHLFRPVNVAKDMAFPVYS